VRRFSFRPALVYRGRKYRGLRGWAGKPFHPPLTDFPVAAYVFAAVFDVLSVVNDDSPFGREMFVAATLTVFLGALVSLLAALTGWADWHRSSKPGTQARRTINAHAIIMITTTVLILVDLLWRWYGERDATATPTAIALLTVVAATLVSVGATYGGTLVYDYGFNVETAGDSPVWHVSEEDVLPGRK
jgi:uncharacterized membrane protein